MAKKRLVRLMTTAMQKLTTASLEAQSADGVEREYVFYGKLENPEELNSAAYYIDQEQWHIEVDLKDDLRFMRIRIRKEVATMKFGSGDLESPREAQYYLAIKSYVKGQPGTLEAEAEIPPTAGEQLLDIFRQEGKGMIKRRYIFPLTGEVAKRFSDEDRPHWEVDAFWIPGEALRMKDWQRSPDAVRCLQPYVKLDLEVKDYDLKVHKDPSDGEYVRFDLPFPIELNDVVYSQPHGRTERDKGRVEAILMNYMTAEAPKPAQPAVEQSVTQSIETLFKNKWLSLMKIKAPEMGVYGYVYSHESRCKGRIVAVLPYRRVESTIQFLIKSEVTPSWGLQPNLSALTGGWEGGEIVEDAKRELLEESGYDVDVSEFVSLGECFASKSSDTVYSLFSVDLTNVPKQTHVGDGSRLEATAESPWVEEAALLDVQDAQVHVMLNRLKVHLKSIGK